MRIKITADSTCDLSPQQIQENDIKIIPLIVNKNGESFYDCVTIQPEDIFAHVAAGGDLCSTSAVSIGAYQEIFEELLKEYDVDEATAAKAVAAFVEKLREHDFLM